MRALSLYAALELDRSHAEEDATRATAALVRGELLSRSSRAGAPSSPRRWASLSVQIHGGMGYIEETGVAQTLRDARITSIYEGTTGIQANDLLGRKLLRDRGAAMAGLLRDMLRELNDLRGKDPALRSSRNATIEALTYLRDATEALLQQAAENAPRAYAVAVPYLQLAGRVLGGALLARSAGIAAQRLARDRATPASTAPSCRAPASTPSTCCPRRSRCCVSSKSGGASVAEAEPDLV